MSRTSTKRFAEGEIDGTVVPRTYATGKRKLAGIPSFMWDELDKKNTYCCPSLHSAIDDGFIRRTTKGLVMVKGIVTRCPYCKRHTDRTDLLALLGGLILVVGMKLQRFVAKVGR